MQNFCLTSDVVLFYFKVITPCPKKRFTISSSGALFILPTLTETHNLLHWINILKFGLKVLRIEALTGRQKMPVCSVTFLISCSTIKPKELEYCYYNTETVALSVHCLHLSLCSRVPQSHFCQHLFVGSVNCICRMTQTQTSFLKSLPWLTSMSSWLTELTVMKNTLC